MGLLSIGRFELIKLLGTKRGWISIAAFILVWLVVLLYVIEPAARLVGAPDTSGLAGLLLERIGWQSLAEWPAPELALYWVVALYLLPMFCIMIAADQMASDKARGTLRYLSLRASRAQIFIGRFVGQCAIQLLLIFVTLVSVVILVAVNTPDQLAAVLVRCPLLAFNLLLVLLPYIALMAVVSVLAKSARQATLYAVIAWILVSVTIGVVQSRFGAVPVLDWVLPGSQVAALLKLQGRETLSLAPVPIIHTLVLLGIGWFAMRRCNL
jgi:ABC-type transport system involved in multi-copper enzyme maturation permease subunit